MDWIKVEVLKIDVQEPEVHEAKLAIYHRRVYVWPEGESVIDSIHRRHIRPVEVYKEKVIPLVLKELNLPADQSYWYSQKAGCSCGCSPGFILSGVVGGDVHVTVKEEEIEMLHEAVLI